MFQVGSQFCGPLCGFAPVEMMPGRIRRYPVKRVNQLPNRFGGIALLTAASVTIETEWLPAVRRCQRRAVCEGTSWASLALYILSRVSALARLVSRAPHAKLVLSLPLREGLKPGVPARGIGL